MGDRDGGSTRLARTPLWALLLVVVLVPLLGVVGIAAQEVTTRWRHRDASVTQQRAAQDLGAVVEVRAALTEEETYTTIVVLARQLDIDIVGLGPDGSYLASLMAARERLDAALATRPVPGLDGQVTPLTRVRDAVDDRTADLVSAEDGLAVVVALVDAEIAAIDQVIELAANQRLMAETSRARLRALRYVVAGLRDSSARIGHAFAVLSSVQAGAAPDEVDELIQTTALSLDAFDRAAASFGPRAREAWEARLTDPSVIRLEALMSDAISVGLGHADPPRTDPDFVVEVLADGQEWASRTIAVLQAVAIDVEERAAVIVADETRTVARWISVTTLLVALALLTVGVVGRALRRTAEQLEGAARQVQQGDFEVLPLAPDGSRELAATISAFNDMTATLGAVERHAVALAESPDALVLRDPLPGRTGQALQRALDTLQASIRQAEQRRVELQELASHDGLTGLLNRRAAFEALERDRARARRDGSAVMVFYIDLDGLKAVNDTHGHGVGDDAICTAADVLASSTRRGDVVARLGGDEFLVAGPVPAGRSGEGLVRTMADRLLEAVNSASISTDDGTTIPLRASIGVAVSAAADESVEDLVRRADAALYVAKQAGRNQVAWPGH